MIADLPSFDSATFDRGNFLLPMARQMLCVITAHKTGVGLVAGRVRKHVFIEFVGLVLVDRILSICIGSMNDLSRGRSGKARDQAAVRIGHLMLAFCNSVTLARDDPRRRAAASVTYRSGRRCYALKGALWPSAGVHLTGSRPASRLITNACAVRGDGISGFIRMLRWGYNGPKLTCWKGFCRTIERRAC
jgi:hypothetical protein